MGNAVTGEHTQHDRACMHATCIRRRWPHPCPAHSLDLGPPHKLPAGTREVGRTPAWGLGHLQGNTEWPEQCPLPQQLQELRKEPWGQQPTLACAPPPPQADGERDVSPGSSRFSAVLGLLCPRTGTRLLRSLPHFSTSQTAMQGGRPPAPVPPGRRAPVGMRGWASLWLSPRASGGGFCLGG